MDTLSHALWGRALFGYRGNLKLALFFGAMPDLFSFGIFFIYKIITLNFTFGKPSLEAFPRWLFISYDMTHSFFMAFVFLFIFYFILKRKDIAFAGLAWVFHILLDFPFHSKEFFPTKIFYPLTDFSFDGVPWNNWYIWLPNITGIFIVFYIRMIFRNEKNYKK